MADRYWVGGTATWDGTAGTKWAATSGGAGGETVPASGADDVYFDAASGAVTVTVSGSRVCKSLNFTGFTGTLTGTSTPSIGTNAATDIILSAGMTFNTTNGPNISIQGTTAVNLTTNGVTLKTMTVNQTGAGATTLGSALTMVGLLTMTAGVFDANDFGVTIGAFASTGTGTRVINMGNGNWNITGSQAALWDMTTVTNATLNAEGSTLTFTAPLTGANTIIAGAKINSPTTIAARTTLNNRINISGSSGGFADLTVIGPNTLDFAGSTVIDNAVLRGTSTGAIAWGSSGMGSPRTITVSGAITGQYVTVRDCTKAGAGTIHFAPGWDFGNTTGVTIIPATPVARYALGS